MLIISLTKFSRSIEKYLTLALTEEIFIRSRKYGLFKLSALSDEDAAKLLAEHDNDTEQL